MKSFWDNEDFQPSNICNAWVATAVVGSALIGAGTTAWAAGEASDAQRGAAQLVSDTNWKMYNQTRADLAPYRAIGDRATTDLTGRLDELTAPIELTQDWLEKTPGYQFTKTQGEKAVQNSAAARGLGVSGAALKGAANFVTGLADNTYKTQFDVARANKTDAFTRLKSLVDTGQSAVAQTGAAGTTTATNASNLQVGASNAEAAMYNKTGQSIANLASDVGGYARYKGLYGAPSNSGNALGVPIGGTRIAGPGDTGFAGWG